VTGRLGRSHPARTHQPRTRANATLAAERTHAVVRVFHRRRESQIDVRIRACAESPSTLSTPARWDSVPALILRVGLPARERAERAPDMPSQERTLTGGELNAAVTSAVVGIHTAHLGRGPRTASTFYRDNIVVTLMHDVMTHAEKALAGNEHAEAVNHMRHLFQTAMEADYKSAVERLTGRTVIAFVSGNNTSLDIASELFVLDRPVDPPP
jgi:uncharacterized protein YbcI